VTGDLVIEPNLWGLLSELAEHPERAHLLARPVPFRDLLRSDSLQLVPSSGLSVGEKHLLQAHRDELAHLLLQASQLMLRATGRPFLVPRDEQGQAVLVDAEAWQARVTWQTRHALAESESQSGLKLLLQALQIGAPRPTSKDLAVASMRVRPSTFARVAVAHAVYEDADPGRGAELCTGILAEGISGLLASYAWNTLASARIRQRRFADAIEASRSATRVGYLGRGPLNWACAAFQAGSAIEASEATSAIRDCACGDELNEFVSMIHSDRNRGTWAPTPAARRLFRLGEVRATGVEQLLEALGRS
jgi:hypothetical protein